MVKILRSYNDTERCFLVKNSAGVDWGENRCGEMTGERGYFRISYDCVSNSINFGYEYSIAITGVHLENEGDSFKIKNAGNNNISVSNITSDKSWLSIDTSSITAILPNEELEVSISINNWNVLSDEKNTAIITIISNSIDSPIITIEVNAYPNFEEVILNKPVILNITFN